MFMRLILRWHREALLNSGALNFESLGLSLGCATDNFYDLGHIT